MPQLDPALGDFTLSTRPVREWVPHFVKHYEAQMKSLEALDDDSVPYVLIPTSTGVFAAAFGCEVHKFDGSNAAAVAMLKTAAEADKLTVPDHHKASTIARIFEIIPLIRKAVGPDVPINVPDIQSPFDIAALIWNKEDLFVALYEEPDAVKRLVEKCRLLLTGFLTDYKKAVGEINMCHCPRAWAPANLGCWLSEDEVGSMSTDMFVEFCKPSLEHMSRDFGGLFIHCCATADHQYENFKKLPNLRALNRVFQEPTPGARPAFEAFAKQGTVFMVAWKDEKGMNDILDLALPETRLLLNLPGAPLDDAKRVYERLRKRCPRR
jgi:hypothetical protein